MRSLVRLVVLAGCCCSLAGWLLLLLWLPPASSTVRYSPADPLALTPAPALFARLLARVRGGEHAVRAALRRAGLAPLPDPHDDDGLEWLRGKTVLLMGDSIDRYHALHLCQFLKPDAPLVPLAWPHAVHSDYVDILSPSTSPALYPAALAAHEDALAAAFTRADGKPLGRGREPARSWVCSVEELDFVVLWGMLFGLDDGVTTPGVPGAEGAEHEQGTWGAKGEELGFGPRAYWPLGTEHFHPPLAAEARLDALFAPLLGALGRETVDLVQVGVGAWDLDMFRMQDQLALTRHPAAFAANTTADALARGPLSGTRTAFVRHRLAEVLDHVGRWPALVGTAGGEGGGSKKGTGHPHAPREAGSRPARVQVRTVPRTPQHYAFPWLLPAGRIAAYQDVVRELVADLRAQGADVEVSEWAGVLARAEREGGGGEGGTWLDHIHPGPLPASVLWAEMLLADLRALP